MHAIIGASKRRRRKEKGSMDIAYFKRTFRFTRLRVSKKMPGHQIERITHLHSGFVCEYTKSYTRADRCVFKPDLYRGSGSGKNTVDFERKLPPV